nr:hypothetical protein HmN_000554400 [Hymenolepis microstoma]
MNIKSTIVDLERHKVRSICKCLSIPDVVEACSAIPGWDFILSLPPYVAAMKKTINRFEWIDFYLCKLLYPVSSQFSYTLAKDAIIYYKRHESFTNDESNHVRFVNVNDFLSNRFSVMESQIVHLGCKRLLPPCLVFRIVCESNSWFTSESLDILPSYRRERPYSIDVLVYKDPLTLHMEGINAILSQVQPNQTLLICVVSRSETESICWFDESFSKVEDIPSNFHYKNLPRFEADVSMGLNQKRQNSSH